MGHRGARGESAIIMIRFYNKMPGIPYPGGPEVSQPWAAFRLKASVQRFGTWRAAFAKNHQEAVGPRETRRMERETSRTGRVRDKRQRIFKLVLVYERECARVMFS